MLPRVSPADHNLANDAVAVLGSAAAWLQFGAPRAEHRGRGKAQNGGTNSSTPRRTLTNAALFPVPLKEFVLIRGIRVKTAPIHAHSCLFVPDGSERRRPGFLREKFIPKSIKLELTTLLAASLAGTTLNFPRISGVFEPHYVALILWM